MSSSNSHFLYNNSFVELAKCRVKIQSLDSIVSCRLIAIAGTTFLMPCHPFKVTRTHFLWKSDAIDSYFTITVTLLEQFVGACLNYNHYGTCIAVLVMAATETVLLSRGLVVLLFVRGIHQSPVDSPHKRSVVRPETFQMFKGLDEWIEILFNLIPFRLDR